jgi:hypothetical protein
MKLLTLIACILLTSAAFSQDTLRCRAMFSDPESKERNKRVSVTTFYVILKDGKPVKFLMADRRRETTMEIWDYRLDKEGRFAVRGKE